MNGFITTVSFPTTGSGLKTMLRANEGEHGAKTDLDVVLKAQQSDILRWTAPSWAVPGDVVFFYHSLAAAARVERFLRTPALRRYRAILVGAAHAARLYGGALFACARVVGDVKEEAARRHFKSRFTAAVTDVHVFPNALPYGEVSRCVRIRRKGAITAVHAGDFWAVRSALLASNVLPGYLRVATPGRGVFKGITAATWRKTCAPSVGFLDEDHFRAYHVINLLRVLSDRDAPIFEECAVPTGGVLDYCVRIGRRWLPVEAKLQAPATQTLRAQLKRYAGQVRFRPTKGALQHTWQRAAPFRSFLIVDIEGIHLNDMERTRVLVTRGEMQSLPDVAIRRRVSAELCAQRGTGTAEVGLAR